MAYLQWKTKKEMPHTTLSDGKVLRIFTETTHTSGLGACTKESKVLQLLTNQGWSELHRNFFYVQTNRETYNNQRSAELIDGMKKYAEYLFEALIA